MARYVALLRGINVGGHAKVAMADLRASFAGLGFTGVATYIQSGNVVFSSPAVPDAAVVEARLAADLAPLAPAVVIRSAEDLARVAAGNPFLSGGGTGADPSGLHVAFLSAAPGRLPALPSGWTEQVHLAGPDLYLYYPDGYARTKLSNAWLEKQLGVRATTRNWRTVTTLLAMAAVGG